MSTRDVLKAVDVAVEGLRIFPYVTPQQLATLTALAAAIKAYRDSPSMANRIALLILCRGEKPTPKENNDATT